MTACSSLNAILYAAHMQDGRVEHRRMVDVRTVAKAVRNATCYSSKVMQRLSYATCLHQFGARHQWMGEFKNGFAHQT